MGVVDLPSLQLPNRAIDAIFQHDAQGGQLIANLVAASIIPLHARLRPHINQHLNQGRLALAIATLRYFDGGSKPSTSPPSAM